MTTYRYYSTQRPVQIGGYPAREHVVEIYNFAYREYCDEIGRKAWGYIVYDEPLDEKDARNYELVLEGQIRKYTVVVKRYGSVTVEAKSRDDAENIALELDEEEIDWDDFEVDEVVEEEEM